MWWCDSNGEISYITAHMLTIRAQLCFKGAAYPRAPLGSSQGKPSAVQTDLSIRGNALPSELRHLRCPPRCGNVYAKVQFHPVCVYVCVIKAINIQHMHTWERNGETNTWVRRVNYWKQWNGVWKISTSPWGNACVLAKLQRCWRANWMKMRRRRWI